MTVVTTLINELEQSIKKGSSDKRVEILRQVTDLFLVEPMSLRNEHIDVFDTVMARISVAIEQEARAELADRIADVPNAPPNVIRNLAHDDISVAKHVLSRSKRLTEADLMSVAMEKGQGHLLAISERPHISEKITDVLVSRGGDDVQKSVASNAGAKLSGRSFERLAARARADEALRDVLTQRVDIAPERLQSMVAIAKATAGKRIESGMSDAAKAALQQALERSANKVSQKVSQPSSHQMPATKTAAQTGPTTYNYDKALPIVRSKHEAGDLSEFDVAAYAAHNSLEEAITAIAVLVNISVQASERLFTGQDQDLLLIICKSQNWAWSTAKALIKLRGGENISTKQIEKAFDSYDQLTQSTAERVLRFLHVREASQGRPNKA
jgi:hypothetical protein